MTQPARQAPVLVETDALPARAFRAFGLGVLVGFAFFAVEFGVSVRFYFRDILSWTQAAGVFVSLAAVHGALGGAVGLAASLVTRPARPWLAVLLAFQLFFLLLLALGWGRLPLPAWVYVGYLLGADALVIALAAGLTPLARRAPRATRTLFALASYGLLLGLGAYALLAGRAPGPAGAAEAASAERPNVVLIVLDTVRADHLSVYGYERETTPELEALAREATVFERALSPAPWTVPSHASLFTGKLPGMHGTHQENLRLAAEEETLAERFRAAGYATAAIVNNPFLSPRLGFAQGFDQFLENWSHMLRRHGFLLIASLSPLLPAAEDHGAQRTLASARRFIRQHRQQRFFLFLNFMEAHAPYGTIPAPLRTRFRDGPPPHRFGYWMDAALPEVVVGQRSLTAEERQTITDLYDAGIFYLDRMLGELLDTLRQEQLLERTLFVVTSDHGEHLGDHDLVSHFFSLYDPVLHVPLIIRRPGGSPARRVPETVRVQDLYPTLLAEAGLAADAEGLSLLGPKPGAGPVVAEAYRPWFIMRRLSLVVDREALSRLDRRQRAIQEGPLKLIQVDGAPPRLYDLAADPEESRDLAEHRPAEARALLRQLERTVESFPAQQRDFPGFDPVSLQRLRSLGYVH